MKKTLNINIGSRVFNIDEDAYDLLSRYLESIKKYFQKINIDDDVFQDIENRISEKFIPSLFIPVSILIHNFMGFSIEVFSIILI